MRSAIGAPLKSSTVSVLPAARTPTAASALLLKTFLSTRRVRGEISGESMNWIPSSPLPVMTLPVKSRVKGELPERTRNSMPSSRLSRITLLTTCVWTSSFRSTPSSPLLAKRLLLIVPPEPLV